ncbi:type II toxin-antitoxin system VapC family toxin [Dongia sp. agr-C8]
MVIDTSAVLGIMQKEDGALQLLRKMAAAPVRYLSAVNFLEALVVMDSRLGPQGGEAVEEFVAATNIQIVPVRVEHARLAREAYRRFGKGNHGAKLNLADCFAYALAKEIGEPLLFKGHDFSKTDIRVA